MSEVSVDLMWLVIFVLIALVLPTLVIFLKKDETPFKELIRPLVTLMAVTASITVCIHGALWCGEQWAVTALNGMAMLCVGFYFTSRAYEKKNKDD